ncbi:hypothetical protein O9X90_12705 [Agrobacterium leguminum]|uniref:hypothetical protein n=1 Tax=Agrobacterium leguminum TaxID=2792015 RepID=UPI0022B815A5|nr:hypothetical protein [Agrobacterium leguminum]MCZ7933173.1 hypothetical protein [Agrobacterium leguminum]
MKKYDRLRLTSACAFGRNKFCAAFSEAEYDDMYSFILVFEGDFEQPWTRFDIPRIIDSATGWLGADGKPVVYVKSDEGDVYSLSAGEEPRHEKIEGSGVYSEDAAGLGYTNRVVTINKTLFVTGYHSQLYRRTGSAWGWFHKEELPRPEAGYEYLIFGDLAGSSENDLYMSVTYSPASTTRKLTEEEEERAAELFDLGRVDEALAIHHAAEGESRVLEGRLYHWNGTGWRIVATPRSGKFYAEPATLSDILVENSERVWAVGNNGVILFGNALDGFQDISFKGNDEDLRSVTKFKDRIVVASDYALHWFDGHVLSPLKPVLDPKINKNVPTPVKVQAVDDILYYFDSKHGIHTFDGDRWRQIEVPPALLAREFKGLAQ